MDAQAGRFGEAIGLRSSGTLQDDDFIWRTFSFDGQIVTHHVDISWNENWTGTNQIRHVRLEGRRLYITTNPQPSPIDGKMTIGTLTWERLD